jgi:hypothetical protein
MERFNPSPIPSLENDPLIKPSSSFESRKRTEQEIEENKKILKEIREDKEIRQKKKKGESLTSVEISKISSYAPKKRYEGPIPEINKEEIEETEEKEEGEKSQEELGIDLNKARTDYAGAYKEYRNVFGKMKEKDLKGFEKTIEPARKFIVPGDSKLIKQGFKPGVMSPKEKQALYDAEGRKKNFIETLEAKGIKKDKAEAIYNTELKKAEYDKTKIELGKKLKEQGIGNAEIFKKLILDERDLLNQAKVESWPPKEKGIFRKGMEWYMKRSTATRLLISTGLVTGVVAGAGGFGAAAVATYAGYRFVRGFGSVMIGKLAGKGVDMAMSRGIEAKKEAAMEKLKSGFDLEKLKETEKELEKIFEETAKRERRKLLIKAAVSATAGAGAAIGMGMLEQAWAGGVKVSPEAIKPKAPTPEAPAEVTSQPQPESGVAPEAPAKPGVIGPEEIRPGVRVETPLDTKPGIDSVIEVQKGDSVWKLVEKQLEARDYFKGLTGSPEEILAKKTYFIDAIKDKIVENPQKFGISSGDADLIKPGEKIDFSSIFDTKEGQLDLIRHSARVAGLNNEQIENILQSQRQIGKSTEEILQQEKTRSISEMTLEEKKAAIAEIQERYSGKPSAEAVEIKDSWAEAGKKVEYSDQEISKIPENYYTNPEEAAKIIAEQAVKDPVFYEKIGDIMGDSYFRYENFRNFKIGLLLDKQGPQWRAIEEHFGEIKGLKPEEYLAVDSGAKNLLERTNNVFENIRNPIERDAARNLTLDQFLRKYFNKL